MIGLEVIGVRSDGLKRQAIGSDALCSPLWNLLEGQVFGRVLIVAANSPTGLLEMRLLIYAMASSGASTFCYFLAQRPGCVAAVDVWSRCVTPPFDDIDEPVVAKATVTMTYSGFDHIASFKPDRTVLFIRDPVAVYASLSKYRYADMFGSLDDKISRFDEEYATLPADVVIRYEDFVARDQRVIESINQLGWPCSDRYYELARSTEEIYNFNSRVSPWLKRHYRDGWGFGNITSGPITTAFAEQRHSMELIGKVVALSPRLSRRYGYSPARHDNIDQSKTLS